MVEFARLTIVLVLVCCPMRLGANECFAKKPLKVSGALCGRVFDVSGAPVPDAQLRLVDENRSVVAETSADSKAEYKFTPLPKGKYRVEAKGWMITWADIEVTDHNALACKRPVYVYVGVSSCNGWVSKRQPSKR
jgi:hypothetical protein